MSIIIKECLLLTVTHIISLLDETEDTTGASAVTLKRDRFTYLDIDYVVLIHHTKHSFL